MVKLTNRRGKTVVESWQPTSLILAATLLVSPAAIAETLPQIETEISPESLTITEIEAISELTSLVTQQPTDSSEGSVINQIEGYSGGMEQITNVNQLRDVSPSDWAYEALRNLVNNYGCIQGYPDGTYRGNRALTRYEFAAGLNACLEVLAARIRDSGTTTTTTSAVSEEDLIVLRRLIQEFEAELATLGTRVDDLEARVAFVEDNQFSTTTKLEGQVIVGVASIFTGETPDGEEVNETTVLGSRVRLELNTSFTGEDLLFTRLATGNFPELADATGTAEGELAFAQPEGNDVSIEVLLYRFPLGDNTEVLLAGAGAAADDFASTVNILDGDGAYGALSAFGTRNPIYYLVDGAGLAITSQLGNTFELSLGYLAGNADDPSSGNGLFNGGYAALGQLVFKPSDRFNLGLTYIHSYKADDTGTGSSRTSFNFLNDLFDTDLGDIPTSSNSYGIELSWQLSDKFVLGGWVGYTHSRLLSTFDGLVERGDNEVFNYAAWLGFPDLGGEGNLGGIVFGMEPKLIDTSVANLEEDKDTSFHVEAFYQLRITDNIFITPGVIWITAPGFNDDNSDLVIGSIRTTFSF
ncbi:iron uptake porin [Oscillatoria salina]|uniref:iron uptake porin n=1 Tax=Oscillatoria salina TaxID=331517 RepID=UPI001CC96DDC|nr:iron uptake porin [Oscillatoria salina]MBZ8182076.1 iron uptake porin [Oscillatoria salina IIICB1]